jgi:helicase SWR1
MWCAGPVENAIEAGQSEEVSGQIAQLHEYLRPVLLRRLKKDVEKELPKKYEHLVLCPLSKRQRFLYDEFMARRATSDDLGSGQYHKIANILMQLRKVCNHPDLFEVRPIVTSFAMTRSAIADFEIKELLVRRRWLAGAEDDTPSACMHGLRLVDKLNTSHIAAAETMWLDASNALYFSRTPLAHPPPERDLRTVAGYQTWRAYQTRAAAVARWTHAAHVNRIRCHPPLPIYSSEIIALARDMVRPLLPLSAVDSGRDHLKTSFLKHGAVLSYAERAEQVADIVNCFAVITPAAVALDLPRLALAGREDVVLAENARNPALGSILHRSSVKLQIAFPDASLLQFDCGKLQELHRLLRVRKAGGHRVLIFTQMTRILDILETFLNLHGYLYSRLDGSTKIEDRQYITERFNQDSRIFCFISSSRSGGVGIK